VSFERNVLYNDNFISLSFRYDLSFARTNISVSRSNNKIYTTESAQGSLAFGSGNKYVHTSNNPSVGKGGISLYPFLDLNQNGIFDKGEHMVKLTSLRVTGSKAIFSEKDSIVRIPDLYAFTYCIVEFDDNDLENIAWRFKNKRYQVLIDPNQFKRIDIPVITIGEVNGMAYMNKDNVLKGIGRILVKIYDKNSSALVAETLSESDGYISYMGLDPGEYFALVDSVQLNNLDFTVDPLQTGFTIKSSEEGDIVSDINFVLNDREIKDVPIIDSLPPVSINMDEIIIVWGTLCTLPGNYYVQCGAFKYKSNAMKMALYIKQNTGLTVGIVLHNELYKVQAGCVATRLEADEVKIILIEKGAFDEMFYGRRQ
jgi:hypothetical protein